MNLITLPYVNPRHHIGRLKGFAYLLFESFMRAYVDAYMKLLYPSWPKYAAFSMYYIVLRNVSFDISCREAFRQGYAKCKISLDLRELVAGKKSWGIYMSSYCVDGVSARLWVWGSWVRIPKLALEAGDQNLWGKGVMAKGKTWLPQT